MSNDHLIAGSLAKQNREKASSKPLFPIQLIQGVIIVWMVLGWTRFTRALNDGWLIIEFISPFLYGYLLLSGLVQGLLGLPFLVGWARKKSWVPHVLMITVILYAALYWFERLFLWQNPNLNHNWGFILLLTLGWFSLAAWGLRTLKLQTHINRMEENIEDDYGKSGT